MKRDSVKRNSVAGQSSQNRALLLQLQQEVAQTARERQARRLAPMLIQTMGIHRYGVDLICWLTEKFVRTNEEAMADWIARQLADEAFSADVLHTPEIDLLTQRLLGRLQVIEASLTC